MSEEPNAPKVPEPMDETPLDERALEKAPGDDSSTPQLSGDRRRVTGDLEPVDAKPSAPQAPDAPLQKPQSTGELLPDKSSADQRRVTGDLEPPRARPSAPEAPDALLPRPPSTGDLLPEKPSASKPQDSGRTESLMRRLTGSLRRSTGPLDKTGPLPASPPDLPGQDVDDAFGKRPPAEPRASAGEGAPPSQGEPKPAAPASQESPNLVRRITGSLRRITGPLGDSSSLRPSTAEEKSQEAAAGGTPGSGGLGERRKRSTGPLGSVIAGFLRGPAAEERPVTQPQPEDYVLEIRQDLASEQVEQPKKQQGSGLLKMITSGFKRMTGTLGGTGRVPASQVEVTELRPEAEAPAELEARPSEIEAEIEEVLLEDRLSGTAVSEPPAWAEPEDIVIELGPPEPGAFDLEEPQPARPEAEPDTLLGDEPISLLDSGAIAALEKAEEEAQQVEAGTDWMTEIRQEAAEADKAASADEEEKRKGVTSPLREFIAGILRPEEKQPLPEDSEVSDDLVTGRLGLDALEAPPAQAGVAEDLIQPEQTEAEEEPGEELGLFVPYDPLQPSQDTSNIFTLSPEDEQLLWGAAPEELAAGEPAVEPETLPSSEAWDLLQIGQQAPEAAEEAETDEIISPPGVETVPILGPTKPLKRRTTGQLRREEQRKPFEDIRSVLLEDYIEAERQRQGKAPAREHPAAAAVALEIGEAAAPRPSGLGAWLETRTTLQKIILVELVLVVLALVTAVPFFTYMLLRGNQAAAVTPSQLPADLPYPTGLTLPGGWQFQLGRSTMRNTIWTPVQGEWLEGTEVRRVVALPWNRQTEAVVRSFQAGDEVELQLSNADLLRYTVEWVEQVPVEDTTIYTGNTPSLVIILYDGEEEAAERWVVFCKR